jgi:uncharacterized repeat protein (TIGR01451 family)
VTHGAPQPAYPSQPQTFAPPPDRAPQATTETPSAEAAPAGNPPADATRESAPADAVPESRQSSKPSVRMTLSASATRKQVGEVVRFAVEVTNTGDRAIENLEIADNFETTLEPLRATESSTWLEGGSLGWKVESLAPGAKIRRAIEFTCLRESQKSCNRATISAPGLEAVADEACLEIVAAESSEAAAVGAESPISLSVVDTADPIKVGGETVYQILLTNKSQQSVFDVSLSVKFTKELRFEGATSPLPERPQILPAEIRFPAAREIRAGENPLSFELRFKGLAPGEGKVRAQITTRGQAQPTVAEHETQVIE